MTSPLMCAHANEVVRHCKCPADCNCKSYTCSSYTCQITVRKGIPARYELEELSKREWFELGLENKWLYYHTEYDAGDYPNSFCSVDADVTRKECPVCKGTYIHMVGYSGKPCPYKDKFPLPQWEVEGIDE